MFLGLIKNEFIKLFSRKKTLIIIGLYILLTIIVVLIGESTERNYFKYNDPEFRIQNLETQIKYEEEYIESLREDNSMNKEDIETNIEYSMDYIDSIKREIEDIEKQKDENYDWRADYKNQIEINKANILELENKDRVTKEDLDNINYIKQEIDRTEKMLETNTSPEDGILNTGINSLYNNLVMVTAAFLFFGLVLFNSDNVSGEYNPGTMKFLLIQPVTRIKVLLSKFVVMVISSIVLIVSMQLIMFLIVGLIKGFGAVNSPILVGLEFEKVIFHDYEMFERVPGSGEFIPLWNYILRMLGLEIILIITFTAFVFMVSTISKSNVTSNTVCISILLGSSIVYSLSTKYRKISQFIFLHFGDIDGIVSGSIIGDTGSTIFTPLTVIIVCIITTLVFIGVALGVFKKRDLLI